MITGVVSLLLALSLGGKTYPLDFFWQIIGMFVLAVGIFSVGWFGSNPDTSETYSADAFVQERYLYQS